ncbi:CocE/NonD family hydrolase [Nocardiopsis sediminis]|uniref:CocE/NonD family hydrolase n=1 Tax=Nocardiopsis sediminis TaxID=1778267 RepID=A0ABV8FPB6_9ACTN
MTDPTAIDDRTVAVAGGARLAVTVTRPPGGAPGPAVLIRTPYGRDSLRPEAAGWARRGYPCVVADVRGRYGSGGVFHPFRHEEHDGAALLDWVLAQDFCDGRVLLAGASYGAYCALVTAAVAPPEVLGGVLVAVPVLGPGETAREPGGAARLACRAGWWTEHAGASRSRVPPPDVSGLLTAVPPATIPHLALGERPAGWDDLWSAPRRGALWDRMPTGVPLLAVGGLHDPFAADTAELAARWDGPARLLLGPWGHRLDAPRPGAALAGRRIGAVYTAWAAAALSGTATGSGGLIAVDGDGQWRRFPLPRRTGQGRTVRAGPAGQGDTVPAGPARPGHTVPADSVADDRMVPVDRAGHGCGVPVGAVADGGTVRVDPAVQGRAVPVDPVTPGRTAPLHPAGHTFVADPTRPFLSHPPGADLPWRRSDPPASDRAIAWTDPLPRGELRGPVTVRLRATADAADADWIARVSLCVGNRPPVQLAHAVVRRAHRPGVPVRLAIDLPPVGAAVPGGARLGVEIAGHHWPRHARNPHTGDDPITTAGPLLAARRDVVLDGIDLPWHPPRTAAVAAADVVKEIAQ